MSNDFLVSIVTPAYNCSKTILETFDSIKKQTYTNWEWIIIEDHSLDNTFELLSNLAKEDKRIVLLRTLENSGTAVARNMGIDNAKGRFVAFLDADDLWKPNKLEVQIKYMIENDVSFTYSNYDVLLPDGKIVSFAPKKGYADYKTLLKRNDIGCLTVVYDSTKIEKPYMPLDAQKREDYAAWLDVTKKGIKAIKINESLAIYRLGNATLTSNKKKMIKYHYRVYRHHEKFGVIKSLYYLFAFMMNKKFSKYN
ncbi:MAG: glycosyltransferase family 2 protein [Clostridia bacterium]|nr:glycosyltransferase family 2 protein [Clostridia bacterium]